MLEDHRKLLYSTAEDGQKKLAMLIQTITIDFKLKMEKKS